MTENAPAEVKTRSADKAIAQLQQPPGQFDRCSQGVRAFPQRPRGQRPSTLQLQQRRGGNLVDERDRNVLGACHAAQELTTCGPRHLVSVGTRAL